MSNSMIQDELQPLRNRVEEIQAVAMECENKTVWAAASGTTQRRKNAVIQASSGVNLSCPPAIYQRSIVPECSTNARKKNKYS